MRVLQERGLWHALLAEKGHTIPDIWVSLYLFCFLREPFVIREAKIHFGAREKDTHITYGCGSKPMISHLGVGAPPILGFVLVGIG